VGSVLSGHSERLPPITFFDRVAPPEDLEDLLEVEALTDDRVRASVGRLDLVPTHYRVTGPGAGWIMGAFTHISPSRFNDETFGAYYTGLERETAIRETVHHRQIFLAATAEAPMEIGMRMLTATLDAQLHDVRGGGAAWPGIYHPSDYSSSRLLAQTLRRRDSWGITYDSVRHPGGQCAAVFRPHALTNCWPAEQLIYAWDGSRIADVREAPPV
jgi:RES domain-containing protein